MQETLIKISFERILKEDHPKAFIKLTLFFLLNPVSRYGQDYEKLKDPGTKNQWFFRLKNKFRKISDVLPDNI